MGFGKKGRTSFTVHRSEEILPGDIRLSKQGSSASSDGEGSADGDRSILSNIILSIANSDYNYEQISSCCSNTLK